MSRISARRSRWEEAIDGGEATHVLADITEALSNAGLYSGRHEDDVTVNALTAKLIDHFTRDTELEVTGTAAIRYGARLIVPAERRAVRELHKELVWCYVIDRPAPATQQHGKRCIVAELLRWTHDTLRLFPADRAEELDLHGDSLRAAAEPRRVALRGSGHRPAPPPVGHRPGIRE
ncbi:hypothetical protein [Streptomyces spectabilis]|uniref:Uncharacterized protein n=1 Tax=Streptomyces spectabilis TaxID=68270 RepID=A0A7W8B1V8_STRST|nr:hypothetical protein [Streptomyces spectabilis]MBB5108829.1 hypothetical protein [Streptomyces spectabilis]MCI3899866.1 hypothetical protein [Streptomyces spectabilis]GGV42377.1 hypothetical protein GCM10010245_66470 [Streptomyces spectabilis]